MVEGEELEESEPLICPNCKSTVFRRDYEKGELVCVSCGYVIQSSLADSSPEWRAFDEEERSKKDRMGAPYSLLIHDYGLTTEIGSVKRGGHYSSENLAQLRRFKKWQNRLRVSSSEERNLSQALSLITKVGSQLNLPRYVMEHASLIYRKALRQDLAKGRSIAGIVAASLYIACRNFKVPKTLDEIAEVCSLSKKEVGRSYRYIIWSLGLSSSAPTPEVYVVRFSDKLGLPYHVEKLALRLLNAASLLKLTGGRGPTGIAAAVVYFASVIGGVKRTQREIAEVAGVTEVTIRNRYKELLEKIFVEIKI